MSSENITQIMTDLSPKKGDLAPSTTTETTPELTTNSTTITSPASEIPTSPPSTPETSNSVTVANQPEEGATNTPSNTPVATPVPLSRGAQALTLAAARQIMLDNYSPWVMSTYGDSAKTKTITTKKYFRIVSLLRALENKNNNANLSQTPVMMPLAGPGAPVSAGQPAPEQPTATPGISGSEAAKFRLWVKSKGFHLGPPSGHPDFGKEGHENFLYLPTGTDKVSIAVKYVLTHQAPTEYVIISFTHVRPLEKR